jgi:hypothetical protein
MCWGEVAFGSKFKHVGVCVAVEGSEKFTLEPELPELGVSRAPGVHIRPIGTAK